MNRGSVGLLPRAPTLETESYLGFMESLRNHSIRGIFAQVAKTSFAPNAAQHPTVRTWKCLMRTQQQQTWQKLQAAFAQKRAFFEAQLQHAEEKLPNRLHYSNDFSVPRYASLDIHLQPGGYVGDTLAGFIFHHGTQVFYQGDNDQDQLHQQVVDQVKVPGDGQVLRILDLGCSIGQCSTALKIRFPESEVTGLDVALPLLRYAHKRAVDQNIEVYFRQGLAESTHLPSGHYDVILAYILFHEVPERLFAPILKEVHRLLRKGGTFTVIDAPNNRNLDAPNKLWLDFDALHNCEPYSPAFVASDFPALLAENGLRVTSVSPTPTFLSCTTAEKDA